MKLFIIFLISFLNLGTTCNYASTNQQMIEEAGIACKGDFIATTTCVNVHACIWKKIQGERIVEITKKKLPKAKPDIICKAFNSCDINAFFKDENISKINFLSIKAKKRELDILTAIDFKKIKIESIIVDSAKSNQRDDIKGFLKSKKFAHLVYLGMKYDIFINKK